MGRGQVSPALCPLPVKYAYSRWDVRNEKRRMGHYVQWKKRQLGQNVEGKKIPLGQNVKSNKHRQKITSQLKKRRKKKIRQEIMLNGKLPTRGQKGNPYEIFLIIFFAQIQ